MNKPSIILASGSPRRKELLAAAGFDFEIITSSVDENYDASLPPIEVAPFLANLKAAAVASELRSTEVIVIGADTIVVLDGQIFGKPTSKGDAHQMLTQLSDRTHQVMTGVSMIAPSKTFSFVEVTDVVFKQLSDEEIWAYIETGEPMDKAGSYGIQGKGSALVDHIEGDYDNVVGLPITRLSALLKSLL